MKSPPGTSLALRGGGVISLNVSVDSIATHCPYCALQCGIHLFSDADGVRVEPNAHFPVNKGGLCVKGWSSASLLTHGERLNSPLLRQADGQFLPVSWDTAFAEIAARVAATQAAHGRDAVGVFGGGSLTNEKVYLLGKFARVALRTSNIDYNGRFCMSSAAAAGNKALGIDRGLPFPLEDLPHASVILLIGGNPAETMPPIMQYFEAQQRHGGRLIVVDPRRTSTAEWASQHLRIRPGTDAALGNGLLHVIIRDGLVDQAYVNARTEGFDEARRVAASYWPERVERITGIPEQTIIDVAHLLAQAKSPMILTARGPEQQAQGVNNALAYINVALALGAVGKASGGFGTLTGQGNGQGGREHGQKADQLPGYRSIADPAARAHISAIWNIDEADLPKAGRSAFELLDSLGGAVRTLFILGSNPVVSAPDASRIEQRLASLDTLIVSEFFLSETARLAHIVLPAAQWAEEGGTMTNLEGRVIRRLRFAPPPSGVRTDLDIICGIAGALGRGDGFRFDTEEAVFNEFTRATAGGIADYSGLSYKKLDDSDGLFWPCTSAEHSGTPRLFAERFPTPSGRARFHATTHREMADPCDGDFPLRLTTGRVLAQYQSGTQTRRVDALNAIASEPIVEVHPATAGRAGVGNGEPLTLTSRRGQATFKVKVTRSIREDTVFVPFHWGGAQSINRLTIGALDPVSRMPEFKVCAVRVERAEEKIS